MKSNDILVKEEVLQLPSGSPVTGYVYIKSYTEQPTKNGNTFLAGQVECIGSIPFKVWGGDCLNRLVAESYANSICYIHGEVNEYAGSKSIIIKDCNIYSEHELQPDDFFEKRYDADEYFSKLIKLIKNNCSEEAYKVFEGVIFPIAGRFCKEYAAVAHHDACASGLLAHTTKVVRLAQILKFYSELSQVIDKDTLFVSAALHDIGKTLEYTNGTISPIGMKMSHLTLGLDLVSPHKDKIIELKGEKFYDDLVSVIQQHHAEYGERPRTLVAYVVHIIDKLEAQLTDLNETVRDSTSNQIKFDEYKLSF